MVFKTIITNFTSLAFGEFSSKAFGFFTIVFIARNLNTAQFGEYSWMMSIYGYLYLLGNFGFETFGIRAIATRPVNETVNGILYLRSLYVGIIILIVLITNYFLFTNPNQLLLLQTASLILLPFNPQYVFRGLSKPKYDGMFRTIQAALFFLLVNITVNPETMLVLPVLWFLSFGSVTSYFFYCMIRMTSWSYSRPSYSSLSSIVRESIPVGIAGLIIMLFTNSGLVILGLFVDDHAVGLYSSAFRIYFFGFTILGLFYITFLPMLSKTTDIRYPGIRRKYTRTLIFASIAIVVSGIFVSESVIIFLFSDAYTDSIPVMQILLFSLAAGSINYAFMNPLQAMRKDTLFIILLSLRAGLCLVFNFVLIPQYGISGAAYSILIAELLSIIASIIALYSSEKQLLKLIV